MPFLLEELRTASLPSNLFTIAKSYLTNRKASLTVAGQKNTTNLTMGAVQGSIGGPSFFKVIITNLLRRRLPVGANLIFYADDGTLMVSAKVKSALESTTKSALAIISNRGISARLRFGPLKTQCMHITRKLKYEIPLILMDGNTISFTQHQSTWSSDR